MTGVQTCALPISYNKDKTKRIIDLIKAFKDDRLMIKKQRVKLPNIKRIRVLSYPGGKINFLVGEGKEIIFVGIQEDATKDIDIMDYIEKTSAFKNKNIKKIFIALNNFSTSARIIAKKNKLIAWDVNDVNSLLRIYCKPVIINENIGAFRYPHIYNDR